MIWLWHTKILISKMHKVLLVSCVAVGWILEDSQWKADLWGSSQSWGGLTVERSATLRGWFSSAAEWFRKSVRVYSTARSVRLVWAGYWVLENSANLCWMFLSFVYISGLCAWWTQPKLMYSHSSHWNVVLGWALFRNCFHSRVHSGVTAQSQAFTLH